MNFVSFALIFTGVMLNATAQILFGPEGIAAFILIAAGALTFYYFNSRIKRD